MNPFNGRSLLLGLTAGLAMTLSVYAADKTLLLIAAPPGHGSGEHEHNAGLLLLQKCLAPVAGLRVVVSRNGWPADEAALTSADAVVVFCDGDGGNLAFQGKHPQQLAALARRGAGLGFIHWATQPPEGKSREDLHAWIGGSYDPNWSVNPFWEADFTKLPSHPVTRGVVPFKLRDEWYFHLRFVEELKGVTPILQAVAPAETMSRPDGPHSGNPAARESVKRGDPQTVMWVCERPDGGRGFGFTGGHYHANWGNDNYRKVVLNALTWIARVEVPPEGIASTATADDLRANLDPKGQPR